MKSPKKKNSNGGNGKIEKFSNQMQTLQFSAGHLKILEGKFPIEFFKDNTDFYFPAVRDLPHAFIFESKDVSKIYGRMSLIGFDPVLKVSGKNEKFEIEVLNSRGKKFFQEISQQDFPQAKSFEKTSRKISGEIPKQQGFFPEQERPKRRTIADALRLVLGKFATNEKSLLGLFGAFSFDFVRLFEDLPNENPESQVDDFCFFLFDSFLHFDLLRQRAHCVLFRENEKLLRSDFQELQSRFARKKAKDSQGFTITNAKFDLEKKEFVALVEQARDLARRGELFEVVFSRTLSADFSGDPFALFEKYRDKNPSPYMFFFDFGENEFLVGASPEMMLRVENGLVHTRPISGTRKRGTDPVSDHENLLELLSSKKERAELDMLIDLGRNDLARICEGGVKLCEYRTVEKYSRVMHTVAHVTGKLQKKFSALDAFISCANAGTLTGAPKVAAMCEIEKHEKTRRGFYGGAIGYFSFADEADTGIIIRTAHIANGKLTFRSGATLLFDCDPAQEFLETENKARAFLDLLT